MMPLSTAPDAKTLVSSVEDHPLFRAALARVIEGLPGVRAGPHLDRIREKTGQRRRSELTRRAIGHGLLRRRARA
jgi:hypothetical protein